ncbi:phosphatidylinositol N-acetylglucosaminyltransferase subunit C [Hygrophoropsis aurantiaca]|uniref:Phosphatidylinositol N-acetylglucosaminyltransferase subunit C n=1 Tax=Hygrophoropsis aurantiaca TaxID=72124 RepID=A0ACB8AD59_9AGAM|nr:phosphatidylinositol N-acetylglucosaminyltransferase subunit C [Hygrophoropsis aurantiaca]
MPVGEWEKVLWKKQPHPDNFIPSDSFFSSLRKNPNFKPYTYGPLVLLSCAITQHLATIFTFIAVFVRLKENLLDPRVLLWTSIACFLVGYMLWEVLNYSDTQVVYGISSRTKVLKSSLLVFLALMGLSPVLRTLTAATSSDSIWAISAFLFILNALLADYSSMKPGIPSQERLTSVLSMNAAISSSVVLASRLPDDLAVFSLVLFGVQLFALLPILRHRLRFIPKIMQAFVTALISIMCIALTASLSISVSIIYAAVLFSVTFIAPALLVWAQKYKNEIRGPWDVAVPRINWPS